MYLTLYVLQFKENQLIQCGETRDASSFIVYLVNSDGQKTILSEDSEMEDYCDEIAQGKTLHLEIGL